MRTLKDKCLRSSEDSHPIHHMSPSSNGFYVQDPLPCPGSPIRLRMGIWYMHNLSSQYTAPNKVCAFKHRKHTSLLSSQPPVPLDPWIRGLPTRGICRCLLKSLGRACRHLLTERLNLCGSFKTVERLTHRWGLGLGVI